MSALGSPQPGGCKGRVFPKSWPEQLGCTQLLVGGAPMEFGVPLLSGMWLLFFLSVLFPIPGKSLLDPFGLGLDLLAQPPPWCMGLRGLVLGDAMFLGVMVSLPSSCSHPGRPRGAGAGGETTVRAARGGLDPSNETPQPAPAPPHPGVPSPTSRRVRTLKRELRPSLGWSCRGVWGC